MPEQDYGYTPEQDLNALLDSGEYETVVADVREGWGAETKIGSVSLDSVVSVVEQQSEEVSRDAFGVPRLPAGWGAEISRLNSRGNNDSF
jgi:hypothetical protein